MEFIRELLQWIKPEHIIEVGGLVLVTVVIFAETGLMVGFFLPGDSLLFTVGLFVALGILSQSVVLVGVVLMVAAILGDQVGYWTGRWMGQKLFEKQDNRFFKYIEQTRAFYNRHGGKTIILGRFVPIVRTFAPILAGAVKMPARIFIFYNVIGGIVWIWSLLFLGYVLGKQFPIMRSYIELVALGIIFLSVLPMIKTYFQRRRVSAPK